LGKALKRKFQNSLLFYHFTNIYCFSNQKIDDAFNFNIKFALDSIKLKSISFIEERKEKIFKYDILKIMKYKIFESYLNLVKNEFYTYFYYNIRDLLNDLHKDLKKKYGPLFWKKDKRLHEEKNLKINN
jgi:hypothetical protein